MLLFSHTNHLFPAFGNFPPLKANYLAGNIFLAQIFKCSIQFENSSRKFAQLSFLLEFPSNFGFTFGITSFLSSLCYGSTTHSSEFHSDQPHGRSKLVKHHQCTKQQYCTQLARKKTMKHNNYPNIQKQKYLEFFVLRFSTKFQLKVDHLSFMATGPCAKNMAK